MTWFNDELVEARRPNVDEGARLLGLVSAHAGATGSTVAAALLEDWDDQRFWRVAPRADAAARESGNEGTGS
jgi:glutamate synthase domain-containing protein 3